MKTFSSVKSLINVVFVSRSLASLHTHEILKTVTDF